MTKTNKIHTTSGYKPSDQPEQVKGEALGRNFEHKKSKTKTQKVFVSLDELHKVGLDVKHKSTAHKRMETPPTRVIEDSGHTKKKYAHASGKVGQHHQKKHETKEDVYVPRKVLENRGEGAKFKSIKSATAESMLEEKTVFAKAKPSSLSNLQAPEGTVAQAFPKKSLTRLLTGDVKPEWIVGLGKMKADKKTPEEGYKDCFVSSLEEYEKKGIAFNPAKVNSPTEMAEKLDLMKSDVKKIEEHGAWLIEIHPSSKLAIPTERKSEWNPGFIEGGYTGSKQQEWVTPNIGIDEEARAGRIKIFKMSTKGETVEWKFFQGKLYPNIPNDPQKGPVEGSYNHAIDTHIQKVKKEAGFKVR